MITPGPWKMLITEHGDRCAGIVAESAWDSEDELWTEYLVQTDGGFYGPNIDDARLMSTSPELLEALKLMVDNEPLTAISTEERHRIMRMAEAAILKAEE